MPVTALVSIDTYRPVGDQWPLTVDVTDEDGSEAHETPVVTVTRPDGTSALPPVDALGGGRFRALYKLAAEGRHIATASTTSYGAAAFAVNAVEPTGTGMMPDLADVNAYLGENSWDDGAKTGALLAEAAAQRAVCVVPAYYPADLRDALLRRVQRNLAMRRLPLAMTQGDADLGSSTLLPTNDPEIRRLERPHRRLLVA